jgi:hypothetical protein
MAAALAVPASSQPQNQGSKNCVLVLGLGNVLKSTILTLSTLSQSVCKIPESHSVTISSRLRKVL